MILKILTHVVVSSGDGPRRREFVAVQILPEALEKFARDTEFETGERPTSDALWKEMAAKEAASALAKYGNDIVSADPAQCRIENDANFDEIVVKARHLHSSFGDTVGVWHYATRPD